MGFGAHHLRTLYQETSWKNCLQHHHAVQEMPMFSPCAPAEARRWIFFDVSQGDLENLVGNLEGIFRDFFWPTEQRLKKFGENFGAFFIRRFVARKKSFVQNSLCRRATLTMLAKTFRQTMAHNETSPRFFCAWPLLGVSQQPLTLILLQKYRDTNGRRIVIQIGGVYTTFFQEEGILLQKYRDRNGRCIAILLRSIRVRGRFDSSDFEPLKISDNLWKSLKTSVDLCKKTSRR